MGRANELPSNGMHMFLILPSKSGFFNVQVLAHVHKYAKVMELGLTVSLVLSEASCCIE